MDPDNIAANVASLPQTNYLGNLSQAYTIADITQRLPVIANQAKMSNLETADTLATRDAVAKNTTQDPNTGMVNLNYQGAINDLMQKSPTAALNFQISMQQRQAELAEKQAQLQQTQLGNGLSTVNMIGSLVQHVNSQEDLDRLNQVAPTLNLPQNILSAIPKTYDPQVKDQLVDQSMKTSEMLNAKIEMGRLNLTQQKQTADINKQDFEISDNVLKAYNDNPLIKNYVQMSNTYSSFKAAQQVTGSAEGVKDTDLLYNLQSIINPDRSPTSSTIEMDQHARGFLDSIGVDVGNVANGDRLSPSQRQQITEFIENKYKASTLQAQAVYNQSQNQLILSRATRPGSNINPDSTLPIYGGIVNPHPYDTDAAGTEAPAGKNMDLGTKTGMANGINEMAKQTPPINASQLQAPNGVIPMAQVQSRAQRTGENPADIINALKAKGYGVQ